MKLPLAVILLFCSGLVWVQAEDKDVSEGDVVVKVLGQSGKINIRLKNNEFNTTDEVVLEMDKMMEKTNTSEDAGKGNYHKVNSFASQEFTFTGPVDGGYQSLDAKTLTFTSKIKDMGNATLTVVLYIFKKAGDIVNGDEVTQVSEGTVKFNIELKDWEFCNGGSNCQGVGSFVDLVISIKSKGKPEKKDRAKSSKNPDKKQAANYNLGNANIQLSSKVYVDGKITTMDSKYPLYKEANKKQTFTFRFPRFNNSVVYDPAVDMTSGANGGQITNVLNLFLAALSIAFVRFLA